MKFTKIALSLALGLAAQAASAGVISVVLDDFSIPASSAANNNRTGSFTAGSGDASIVSDANYPTSPVLSISVNATPSTGSTYTLSYSGIALPTGATAGSVIFTTLWNNYGGQLTNTSPNAVTVGGTTTLLSTGEVVYGSFAGGAVSLAFNTPPTRSWDILIDNIKVTFNCANSADTTFTNVAAFNSFNKSCAAVPVPGSLALLGLGGIAAGLVSRRRAAK